MDKTPPQLQLANQLCFAMYRASRAAVRAYGPELAPLGLTYPQYLAMLVLWEAGQALPVSAIGERLQLETGTLTPILKRLEEQGMVVRTRDATDERRVLVRLTDAGAKLQARAREVPVRIFRRYGLDLPTARKLLLQLDDVARALEGEEG
jgi:DNA-binding MarR family transcriptional regulator